MVHEESFVPTQIHLDHHLDVLDPLDQMSNVEVFANLANAFVQLEIVSVLLPHSPRLATLQTLQIVTDRLRN